MLHQHELERAKISLIPFTPKLGKLNENLEKIIEHVSRAIDNNLSLVVFPELATSGYLLENLTSLVLFNSNNKFHPKFEQLSKKIDIIFGTIAERDYSRTNAAMVYSQGKLVHQHDKIYAPTYGMFDESRYYQRGESLEVFNSTLGKSATLICDDAWHPILPYLLFMKGAKHVFILSASPSRGISKNNKSEFTNATNWVKRLQIYAESYGQFYYYVNLDTVEDGLLFAGESYVITPFGKVLTPEADMTIEVNLNDLRHIRSSGGPFQEENFALNHALLTSAFNEKYKI